MVRHLKLQHPEPALPGDPAWSDWRTIRRLMPHLWPKGEPELRARVVGALVLLVAAKLATVYVPIVYKHAVDTLDAAAVVAVPVALIVAYGVLRLVSQVAAELRDALFAKVAQRAVRREALAAFHHLHALPLSFHLDRQTGGMSRAIERGVKGVEWLLTFMLFSIVPIVVEIGLVCGILWSLFDWRFALVTFATIVCYIAFTFTASKWRTRFRREMNARDGEANTKAIDSLLNFETVKYFGNETHEERRYDGALRAYERAAILSKISLSGLNIGQGAIIAVGVTAIMTMAGYGIATGTMTVGDFVMVNTYLLQLYIPLNFLGTVYREIRQALIDMEQMFRITAITPAIQDKPGASPLAVGAGVVAFDRVSFAYRADRPILHDVSFTVPSGRSLAIVGSSGAGKSTIARLIYRFYDVDGGTIRIDGQDLRDVTQASVRGAIGIVPQDTVLFNDTIYYNIAYGRPAAAPAEVENAARLARVHDFVMTLPEGYQTRVGERGLKLSGGEKQRVAIARTILKGPLILMFDEATSALDTHTERAIQTNLREVARDRTTIMVAHRLSTVVDADEIIVLDGGRVVERGRHADLLAREGAYAAMWRRQQEAEARAEAWDGAMPMTAVPAAD
ncbi:MAG: ABC transporter ATP-binding protein/permease [Alphaproteobacteria bacterium]|nr:ABC transporter ATP-binding protein/permease [Alphaproteobacteria bacterium]